MSPEQRLYDQNPRSPFRPLAAGMPFRDDEVVGTAAQHSLEPGHVRRIR